MMNDMSGRDGVRLNKWIAESGVCSRREADRLIADGRVTVDGRPGALGDKVLPGMTVCVDGKPVRVRTQHQQVYIALNKPVGSVEVTLPAEAFHDAQVDVKNENGDVTGSKTVRAADIKAVLRCKDSHNLVKRIQSVVILQNLLL